MSPELDKKLCEAYPTLFKNRNAPILESNMAFGFMCGDGWYPIIDRLCGLISWDIEHNNCPEVTVDQVKEKFGTLRFYYTGGNDKVDGYVGFAESLTEVTCEVCGKEGRLRGGGWLQTLCDEHAGDKPDFKYSTEEERSSNQ